jgi:3-deoxy-7-phosphoheptulonate synthase
MQLPLFEQYGISILQIGANNMKNYELLKEAGNFAAKHRKAVMLKSFPGLKSYKQMLASAEYLLHEGCFDIIFCERGLEGSSGEFRNTPNPGLVHDLRKFSYFPIIVDPSHACGIDSQVFLTLDLYQTQKPHGFMIEVRRNNEKPIDECDNEVCDFKQSVTHNAYKREILARRL